MRHAPNDLNSNQYDIRVDHYLTQSQSLFGRWSQKTISIDSPRSLGFASNTNDERYKLLVVSHNYTISSNVLNEARAGLTLPNFDTSNNFDGRGFTNGLGLIGIGRTSRSTACRRSASAI